MELGFSNRFGAAYRGLNKAEREQLHRALALLRDNPRHPSLRAQRWPGSEFWYARASRDLRFL